MSEMGFAHAVICGPLKRRIFGERVVVAGSRVGGRTRRLGFDRAKARAAKIFADNQKIFLMADEEGVARRGRRPAGRAEDVRSGRLRRLLGSVTAWVGSAPGAGTARAVRFGCPSRPILGFRKGVDTTKGGGTVGGVTPGWSA